MKPPVQYAMMPPRVDAPVGKMKPVQQPKVAKMRGVDEALDYYLGPTGIPDKLRAVNQMFNPVETLGGSMRASQKMLAPDTAPMDRVRYMGDMLSGIGGFVAPMVAAAKVGAPAVAGVVDAFTGLSTAPATQAAKTTATDFAMGESGAFAGLGARGADRVAAARAEEMLKSGASRDDVWKATGWMRGVDGKMRFEIDDSGMGLRRGMPDELKMKRGSLGTGIKHDDLFAAYPDMHGVAFKPGYDMPGYEAMYEPTADAISINRLGKSWRDRAEFKGSTAHEAQHAIQQREGFAQGGNYLTSVEDEYQAATAQVNELIGRGAYSKFDDWRNSAEGRAATRNMSHRETKQRYIAAHPEDTDFQQIADLETQQAGLEKKGAQDYRLLSGEVEARNVQTRLNMTAAERRATPPWATQDVPDDQQIVRKAIRLGQ